MFPKRLYHTQQETLASEGLVQAKGIFTAWNTAHLDLLSTTLMTPKYPLLYSLHRRQANKNE